MEETATFERQLDPWWTRAHSQTNNILCKKTIHRALEEQVLIINELLEEECDNYYLDDIYNVLPNKITWNGRTGYLKISKYDIVYSSLETELKGQVVVSFSYMIGNLNVFDAFIDAIKFLNKYKEQIIVHE